MLPLALLVVFTHLHSLGLINFHLLEFTIDFTLTSSCVVLLNQLIEESLPDDTTRIDRVSKELVHLELVLVKLALVFGLHIVNRKLLEGTVFISLLPSSVVPESHLLVQVGLPALLVFMHLHLLTIKSILQLFVALLTVCGLALLLSLREVGLLVVSQLLQLRLLLERFCALTTSHVITVPVLLLLLLKELAVSRYHSLVHLLRHLLLELSLFAQVLSLFIEHVEHFFLLLLVLGRITLLLLHGVEVLQPSQDGPLVHFIIQ